MLKFTEYVKYDLVSWELCIPPALLHRCISVFSSQRQSSYRLTIEEASCRTRYCPSSAEMCSQRCLAAGIPCPGDWIAAISWVQMAMKKWASDHYVLYVWSREWGKDKCDPVWCWFSSEMPCSVHHVLQTMQKMQNMLLYEEYAICQLNLNILHILHIPTIYMFYIFYICYILCIFIFVKLYVLIDHSISHYAHTLLPSRMP